MAPDADTAEPKLRLHAANNIRGIIILGAKRSKRFQGKPDFSTGFLRLCLSRLDLAVDPSCIILAYDVPPGLLEEKKSRELIYALQDLRARPIFRISWR